MKKNKKPKDLPEEETSRSYECISMDGFETDAGEHGLAVIDRHTGFIWARKAGDKATGTARVMKKVLNETIGCMLNSVKRFKTNGDKNLTKGAVEELCEELKIKQEKSSAHHPSGNKCIENAVQRIKRAIGDRKIEDAMTDINALNHGNPYNSKTLTPAEEMFGQISPVPGIPMTEEAERELVDRDVLSEKKTRSEVRNTNPTKKAFSSEDRHPQTWEENKISK